jgi:hypothetical protein
LTPLDSCPDLFLVRFASRKPPIQLGEGRVGNAVGHHGGDDDEAAYGPDLLDARLPQRVGRVI